MIGILDLVMTGTGQPDILITGGALLVSSGRHGIAHLVDYPAISATGGTADINNVRFGIPAASRTSGVIVNSSSGALRLKGNYFASNSGLYTGDVITVGHDNVSNWISGNAINGWGYTIGFSTSVGYYDFDDSDWEAIVITPQFATNGDFVPGSVSTTGGFKRRGSEVFFDFTTTFDTNAYTTASGTFSLGTNLPPPMDSTTPVAIGAIALVTATGVIYAQINQTTSNINFPLWVSNTGLAALTTANVPASKTGVSFRISGTYRVR
jgi:hypothetical protein